MKHFLFGTVLAQVAIINACFEPSAPTVHIQNYDGPIYVQGENRSPNLCNMGPTCDNRYPTVTNPTATCDNRYPTLIMGSCDNRYPGPTCDNRYPTLTGQTTTFDYRLPTLPSNENQSPILHSSGVPYHQTICETDCKCVTKHQTACVPVNSVQQNTCTPGYYCCQYPEDYSGYGYPDGQSYGSDTDPCPRISETLIPLLKTFLNQSSGKCPKYGCQCGRNS